MERIKLIVSWNVIISLNLVSLSLLMETIFDILVLPTQSNWTDLSQSPVSKLKINRFCDFKLRGDCYISIVTYSSSNICWCDIIVLLTHTHTHKERVRERTVKLNFCLKQMRNMSFIFYIYWKSCVRLNSIYQCANKRCSKMLITARARVILILKN